MLVSLALFVAVMSALMVFATWRASAVDAEASALYSRLIDPTRNVLAELPPDVVFALNVEAALRQTNLALWVLATRTRAIARVWVRPSRAFDLSTAPLLDRAWAVAAFDRVRRGPFASPQLPTVLNFPTDPGVPS